MGMESTSSVAPVQGPDPYGEDVVGDAFHHLDHMSSFVSALEASLEENEIDIEDTHSYAMIRMALNLSMIKMNLAANVTHNPIAEVDFESEFGLNFWAKMLDDEWLRENVLITVARQGITQTVGLVRKEDREYWESSRACQSYGATYIHVYSVKDYTNAIMGAQKASEEFIH
jgi:hypothetical protein